MKYETNVFTNKLLVQFFYAKNSVNNNFFLDNLFKFFYIIIYIHNNIKFKNRILILIKKVITKFVNHIYD